MRLLKFEFRKLASIPVFWGLSLFLMAANLITLYTMERNVPVYFYVHEQQESYRHFMEGDDSADIDGYYGAEKEAQENYIDSYAVFVEEMSDRVNSMAQTALYADTESFVYRNLVKTQADFSSFSGSVLLSDNCFGIREFAGYNGGLLFVLIFLAMLTYYVIFFERDWNITLLLKGCKWGHTPLASAKLTVMLVAAIAYLLIQEAMTMLFLGWMYGYGDLSRAVQSVSIFRNCVYHLTVGGALAAIIAVRAVVVAVFTCVFFLIGMIIKNGSTAIIVTGSVLGGEYLIERFFEISGSLGAIKCTNPFYYWDMQQALGEYLNFNLFGYPVGKDVCAAVTALLVMVILPVTGVVAFNRMYQIKSHSRLERVMQWLRARLSGLGQRLSLVYYELHKIMVQQKKGGVFILLLVWGVYEAVGVLSPAYYASSEEAAYHYYISLVQGPVTEETFSFFEGERIRLDDMRGEIKELINSGSTEATYMSQILQNEIKTLEGGFEAAQAQFVALQEKPGAIWDKYMIDERAYQEIWQDVGADIGCWVAGSVAILYFISGIYPADEKKKMLHLLRTTRNGQKKLDNSKIFCVVIFTGLVYILTELPLFLRYVEIDCFSTNAQKLCDFTAASFSSACPLWLMIAAVFTLKALSFLAVGSVGLQFSKLTKNETLTFLAGSGIVGMISMVLYHLEWDINKLFISIFLAR